MGIYKTKPGNFFKIFTYRIAAFLNAVGYVHNGHSGFFRHCNNILKLDLGGLKINTGSLEINAFYLTHFNRSLNGYGKLTGKFADLLQHVFRNFTVKIVFDINGLLGGEAGGSRHKIALIYFMRTLCPQAIGPKTNFINGRACRNAKLTRREV